MYCIVCCKPVDKTKYVHGLHPLTRKRTHPVKGAMHVKCYKRKEEQNETNELPRQTIEKTRRSVSQID